MDPETNAGEFERGMLSDNNEKNIAKKRKKRFIIISILMVLVLTICWCFSLRVIFAYYGIDENDKKEFISAFESIKSTGYSNNDDYYAVSGVNEISICSRRSSIYSYVLYKGETEGKFETFGFMLWWTIIIESIILAFATYYIPVGIYLGIQRIVKFIKRIIQKLRKKQE
jgi:uncharacterized membrane protein